MNEKHNYRDEENSRPDIYMGPTSASPAQEAKAQQPEGFTFNTAQFIIGLVLCFIWFNSGWSYMLYLTLVVIIHELGHVIVGKSFGCVITEMQVFLLAFVSYKPKVRPGSSSWRNITWSLGMLPLGGFTVFKTRGHHEWPHASASSPYLSDKPAWQRLLVSAGGVAFNFATFLLLYILSPHLPAAWSTICWPIMSLSLIFAVLNILPVYPLDGGAIIFAIYEIITGKKPPQKFVNICGIVGFVLIVLFFWVFPQWIHGIMDKVFDVFF